MTNQERSNWPELKAFNTLKLRVDLALEDYDPQERHNSGTPPAKADVPHVIGTILVKAWLMHY